MRAWCAGDTSAFDELFARWAPHLRRLLGRRVARSQDADELVQETFLRLHRARRDYRQGSPLRPWLVTIALNVEREFLRKGRRRPLELVEVVDERVARTEPPATAARLDVHRALASLPDDQRQAIELHWLAGLTFPEVAKAVGASLSAVKVRAHRGYARMRDTLSQEGEKP